MGNKNAVNHKGLTANCLTIAPDNDKGQVVGYSKNADYKAHAFLYDGTMHDLGTLGVNESWAYGINNSGQVVGSYEVEYKSNHAFLYSNGVMTDLNSLLSGSGWTFTDAWAINNSGQIAGWGYHYISYDPGPHAYLLTPIPEPATLGLMVAGGLAAIRRRKH